jgi:hypothetical protein
LHGQHHVGAGIPIRHRKDIQGIHRLLVRTEPDQAGLDKPFHRLTINLLPAEFFNTCGIYCHDSS